MVKKIIAEELAIPESSFTDESSFEELGADSLDFISLISAVEQHFNVKLDKKELASIATVGDLTRRMAS